MLKLHIFLSKIVFMHWIYYIFTTLESVLDEKKIIIRPFCTNVYMPKKP